MADLGCGEGTLVALLLRRASAAPGPRHRRVAPGAGTGRPAAAPGHDAGPAAGAGGAAAVIADLRRRAAGRPGRGGAHGGHRARRPARLGARSRPCSARPGPAPSWSPRRTPSTTSASPTWPPGAMRHPDHRFEWTRPQFRDWAAGWPAAAATRCASCRSARRPRGRPAHPAGGVHPCLTPCPDSPSAATRHPRAVPGRAGRRVRVGQDHVRPPALRPVRGASPATSAAAWSPTTRTTRPPPPTRSTCSDYIAGKRLARPADGDRRDQRAARRAQAARRAGPRARRAAGRRSCWTCRETLPASATRAGPDRTFGARSFTGSRTSCAGRSGRSAGKGFRTVHVLRGADEVDAAVVDPRTAADRPPRPDRPVRRDRRRARLPRRAGGAARPARLPASPGTRPVAPAGAVPPGGPHRGLPRRPGGPGPGLARTCSGW